MNEQERQELIEERDKIRLELDKARFADPKKVRRIDAINSLLMTDGETETLQWKTVKGRGGNKGLNAKKPYYRKGKVG
ncbi:MAG: hypothetical protein ACOC33_02905 [bacterium]